MKGIREGEQQAKLDRERGIANHERASQPCEQTAKNNETHLPKQLPGETTFWYERFLTFVNLGSIRTLVEAEAISLHRPRKACVSASFRKSAQQWRWKERAEQFDVEKAKLIASSHQESLQKGHDDLLNLFVFVSDTLMRLIKEGFTDELTARYIKINKALGKRAAPSFLLSTFKNLSIPKINP